MDHTIQTLAHYAGEKYDELNVEDIHSGTWEVNGRIYMEVSYVLHNEQQAVKNATQSDRIGIYALSTGKTKYIKD